MHTTHTLVYLFRDGRVCLGLKKRGFGAGWWNGFGGKIRAGESVRDAAARELAEECGVAFVPDVLQTAGELTFTFRDDPGKRIGVAVFRVDACDGEPAETEEMRPAWFASNALPYDAMWPDDRIWMPAFLRGVPANGRYHFDGEHRLLSYEYEAEQRATA